MDVAGTFIVPDWPAHPRVRGFVTTRASGDMTRPGARRILADLAPEPPVWIRQVHGTTVIDADPRPQFPEADAAVAREPGRVCAVVVADCMPVLLSDAEGSVVGIAHAGWRGLAAGVIEATVSAMRVTPSRVLAWLGPAIGPRAYEVGDDVRKAFAGYEDAFTATRPQHWRLDLYAVARRRLAQSGVTRVYGGDFCTHSDSERFFSYRRDQAAERMAALVWLAQG
jgi:YfiH family protein